METATETATTSKKCARCKTMNPPTAKYCYKCDTALDMKTAIGIDEKRSSAMAELMELILTPCDRECIEGTGKKGWRAVMLLIGWK